MPAGGTARSRGLPAVAVKAMRAAAWAGIVALALFGAAAATGWWLARESAEPAPEVAESLERLRSENARLRRALARRAPAGLHLVVDTAANRIRVRDGDRELREIVVSCGSGGVLEDPSGKRTWVFDTPRGERTVRSKVKNPTWIKPDWAFIEEGEPPPKRYDDRVEEGVLGDYALGIGDGYFIHGTLYTRLLGRNVTHGCIRVGDDDLEFLYRKVPLGTRVYLY